MSSPAPKAPPKLGSKAGTPARARKASGSSAASKPSAPATPKSTKKATPRKLSQKAPEPTEDDEEEQSIPETPSPKSKKKTEQRRPVSPPDDASEAPSASGSAAPLGRATSGLSGKAKSAVGKAKDTAEQGAEQGAETVQNGAKEAAGSIPVPLDLAALKGLEVVDGGEILSQDGTPIGKVVEGDPEDLVGQTVGDDGEIIDEDGDLIGRVDILHDVADKAKDAVPEEAQSKLGEADLENVVTDLAQLDGLPVSDGGVIKNAAGQIVGRIVEGDPEDLIGYTLNDDGEIVDEDGDAIGRVDLIPVEEQKKAIEEATGDVADKADGAKDDLEDQYEDAEDGLPTDQVKDAAPDAEGTVDQAKSTAEDVASDAEDAVSDVDDDAVPDVDDAKKTVDGTVDDAKDTAEDGKIELEDKVDDAKDTAEGAADDAQDTLDGAKDAVDGTAEDAQDNLEDTAEEAKDGAEGAAEDAQDTLDDAKETAEETAEDAADEVQQELPDLSTLEGLSCNKRGYIIDQATGKPVGELTEGDAKKIAKLGATLDDKGQFWDNRGNVIGKAKTLPIEEDDDEEGPFSGLEGLVVGEDGFIEDENSTRVGRLVEGDAKKLSGRGVDEDGEILDRKGNVIGRAERLEPEEEEPEEAGPDFSAVNGLTCNKAGYVIGPEGYPIARVVEGNPKELAGKKIEDGEIYDGKKVVGRVELIPDDELDSRPEGVFAGMESLYVTKDGFVEDDEGSIVGKLVEGDPKKLRGRAVDEDGEITDKYGNVKGRAEPYEVPEEEEEVPEEVDLSILEGKVVNKSGNVVDPATGAVVGRIVEGDKRLAGRKVDGKGQIWGDNGQIIGRAELIPGAEENKAEGPFYGFDNATVGKDGVVLDGEKIIGRLIEGDAKRLLGRKVDEDGDVVDKNGNTIGKAERWEPEEKKRDVNPMSGRKVNKEGEVRDADGNLIGKLTHGNLATLVGKVIDDNGYVVDNDGNKIGECTLLENIPEPEPEPEPEVEEEGPTAEEQEAAAKAESDRQLAEKMIFILRQTLDQIKPVCKQITDVSFYSPKQDEIILLTIHKAIEKADRTPKDELDEEKLVQQVKPLLEEGGRILQECNGSIRALDPDGRIAATAKARAASRDATPEEYQLADLLKELTETVVKTIDNGKKRIADMPHAKKKLSPLWALLSEPLFQIIAAVGLLLTGVLGLVGRLLDGLGLGGLLNGLLGSLGLNKLIDGLGLGSLTDALGLGGKK
jgi:rubrerythrin